MLLKTWFDQNFIPFQYMSVFSFSCMTRSNIFSITTHRWVLLRKF